MAFLSSLGSYFNASGSPTTNASSPLDPSSVSDTDDGEDDGDDDDDGLGDDFDTDDATAFSPELSDEMGSQS